MRPGPEGAVHYGVTFSTVAGEVIEPEVAVMLVDCPAVTGVTKPLLPALLLTEAAVGFDEFQVTALVMSCVPPPTNVPVAVNCWAPPPTDSD